VDGKSFFLDFCRFAHHITYKGGELMKLKVRLLLPALMVLGSFAFAEDELQYDDGSPAWGYANGG
jgi:hypothetical protein